jgi:hypothetical protein
MCSRAASAKVREAVADGCIVMRFNSVRAGRNTGPGETTTARTMTFCSSRIFPGQSCAFQSCNHFVRDQIDRPVEALRKFSNEVLYQKRNILGTLPQGREVDRNYIQPVVQVRAELFVRHKLPEILIGGCHHSYIDANRLAATQSFELLFLQSAQELGGCNSSGRSPISSRNSVPPFAIWNRSLVWVWAPV